MLLPGFARTSQIALSAAWSWPNTPEAEKINTPTEITVAQNPLRSRDSALSMISRSVSPAAPPSRSPNCSTTCACTSGPSCAVA